MKVGGRVGLCGRGKGEKEGREGRELDGKWKGGRKRMGEKGRGRERREERGEGRGERGEGRG